jgi:Fibronectin type III domain
MELAGKKIPKWAVIGGAGAVVAGGIYAYKRSSNSSSSSASTATGIDPVTGLPYSEDQTTDPVTGQTYLSEAQEYGSVSAAEAALLGANSSAYDYAGGSSSGGGSADTGTSTTVTDPVSGATYSTTAIDPVTGETYAAEIATYGGVALAEAAYETAQLAVTNPAPAPVATPTPTPVATTPTNGAGTSYQFPAPTGLKVTSVGSTSVSISWNPVAAVSGHSPTGYTVAVYQTNGVEPYQNIWGGTSGTISGLHPSWQYHVNVWANGAPVAPAHATVTFTTTK